ncbi:hypothetical protein B0T14DRAFT_584478 [Immersiella caudata]|uniref:Uncharacterized protein n=1 Tax=Immersiella caudata TaxID=314043 RepID=A0AA39WPI9_9PEZI|nr:hypothetical protein B0T14DRAFT_584478 [Immersiella caudata]
MDLTAIVRKCSPALSPWEALYKDIHQHPELSQHESRTAALIAAELAATASSGLLRNGPGPTVLLRAEHNALPINRPVYRSRAPSKWTVRGGAGSPLCTPAAMTCTWPAGGGLPSSCATRARNGTVITVVALFQPDEEHMGGAQAVLDDGLHKGIGVRPDAVFAQHLMQIPAGIISINPGPALQNAVQEIRKAGSYASINTWEMHAGEPGADWVTHADLVLAVKAYDPAMRLQLLDRVREILNREASSSGAIKPPRNHNIRASTRHHQRPQDGKPVGDCSALLHP